MDRCGLRHAASRAVVRALAFQRHARPVAVLIAQPLLANISDVAAMPAAYLRNSNRKETLMNRLFASLIATAIAATTIAAHVQSNDSKAARFQDQEKAMQEESTNMPSASPSVNRNAKAADPLPKAAATKAGRKAQFAAEEKTWQDLSTNLPSASPQVNRNAKAADPIPKAATRAEKEARFREEEAEWQKESTR